MKAKNVITLLIAFALVCTFVVPGYVLAQVGKITGDVRDAQTGDALPGANVQIRGTTMGAATDIEGKYTILNVPAGTYTLEATFIGYSPGKFSNVKVHVGLTTELDFNLQPEAIEASTVTVVAEKPLVQKNATNAVRIVTSEELENLPLRGVEVVANLQPGIVAQDGNIYIRGGRDDEVGTYVEGANVRSVYDGDAATDVIPEALEELQIQAGGFTAQYGGANSGIVSYVMKSGTPEYHFSLRAETDNFSEPDEKFLDTYSYGYSNTVFTASGPVPFTNNKVKFFVAGENQFEDDHYQNFYEPFDFINGQTVVGGDTMWLVDTGGRGSGTKGDTLDALSWAGGNVPNSMENRYTGNGVLTVDLSPVTLRLSGAFTYLTTRLNQNPLLTLFNNKRNPQRDYSDALVTAKITHVLAPTTFYTLSLNYFDQRRKDFDPFIGDNYWLYSDSLVNASHGFDGWLNYTNDPDNLDIYGFRFQAPGDLQTSYNKYKRNYMGGNLDFTHQMKDHMIQFGGTLEYWTLRNYSGYSHTTGSFLSYWRNSPDILNDQEALDLYMRSLSPNNYGYDYYGNETDGGSLFDAPMHPIVGAAYLQDKFEIKDLVINAGLRFDYFDMDQYVPNNYEAPGFSQSLLTLPEGEYEKMDAFATVSPRLGFAFPVTDRTVFHLQWGKFVQMPEMSRAYRSNAERISQYQAGFFYTDPMGFGIKPERTTQYEIGLSQVIAANASFDATLFYKDIKNQLQTTRVFTSAASAVQTYDIHTNGDFATTKGMEFRLTLRRTNRMQGFVNYTYSQAKGTGSYSRQNGASLEQNANQITIITPLYFNQTHRGSISLDYRFAENDGGPILERTGLNMLFTFNSGHAYTLSTGGIGQNDVDIGGILSDTDPRNRRPVEAIGSSTTPWVFNFDLRLDKTFTVGPVDLNAYVYVQNLLNRKNVLNVYPRTGNADTDGYLEDPDLSGPSLDNYGEAYRALYQAINNENRRHWYIAGMFHGDLWGTPRQIRAGINIMY